MRRRDLIAFLGGVTTAWPLPARAQQKAMPIIGFLRAGQPPNAWIEAFHQGLGELGFVHGKNVAVEFRFTADSLDELTLAAKDLAQKADVIVASAAPAAQGAKQASAFVPIVFVVANPVEMGLVQSLAHPGTNMTGLAENPADLAGKRLELLRELVPTLRRVVVLWDQGNPSNPGQLGGAEVAAQTLGMQIEPVGVKGPADFDSALRRDADGLLVLNSPLFTTHRGRVVELSVKNRLPAVYGYREVVQTGGLMSYGTHFSDLYRRAGVYAGKIINGAKPADLPVEQPTKFELVINMKTAKALGLSVPPSLLARADEVIE